MSDFRRLLTLFRPHRRAALVAILAMLGVALFTAVIAYLMGPLLDEMLTPEMQAEVSGQLPASQLAALKTPLIRFLDGALKELRSRLGATSPTALPFILFAAFLLKNVCAYVGEYRFNAVGLAFVRDLRKLLYERILGQSGSFHARYPSGDLIARVTGDVDRVQSLFGTDLADLVQSLATLLGLVVLVVSRSPELTGVALLIVPAIVAPVVLIAKRLRSISRASRERMGDLTGVLSETVRGHRVVQAYGAEGYESSRFGEVNDRTFRLTRKAAKVMALSSPLVETASVLALVLLLIYASGRMKSHAMTFGVLVSFCVGLVMMYQPFKRATRTNLALQQAFASARRLFEVLDAPIDVVDRPGARALAPLEREIRFEQASFAYPGGEPILRGIDLVIPKGSVTAIVGPSGAGKTTLANLIARFMDVTGGRIAIDGVDVRDVTLASLRGTIGLVTQDVVLFDDTIGRNVAYGRTDVPEARLLAALEAANARAFVLAAPGGLEARTGEGGTRLSGGQKQRLAIARALVKDPPILILDEATSALDTESERAVQEALDRLMVGRTVVVIAHRLSTIQRADQIVVLDRGRIVEQGNHETLLSRDGLYRRLYDLSRDEMKETTL